jgi:hypothetical protein
MSQLATKLRLQPPSPGAPCGASQPDETSEAVRLFSILGQ